MPLPPSNFTITPQELSLTKHRLLTSVLHDLAIQDNPIEKNDKKFTKLFNDMVEKSIKENMFETQERLIALRRKYPHIIFSPTIHRIYDAIMDRIFPTDIKRRPLDWPKDEEYPHTVPDLPRDFELNEEFLGTRKWLGFVFKDKVMFDGTMEPTWLEILYKVHFIPWVQAMMANCARSDLMQMNERLTSYIEAVIASRGHILTPAPEKIAAMWKIRDSKHKNQIKPSYISKSELDTRLRYFDSMEQQMKKQNYKVPLSPKTNRFTALRTFVRNSPDVPLLPVWGGPQSLHVDLKEMREFLTDNEYMLVLSCIVTRTEPFIAFSPVGNFLRLAEKATLRHQRYLKILKRRQEVQKQYSGTVGLEPDAIRGCHACGRIWSEESEDDLMERYGYMYCSQRCIELDRTFCAAVREKAEQESSSKKQQSLGTSTNQAQHS